MGDTIVYSGAVVDLDEAEASLAGHPAVASVAAVGINDVFTGDGLHLFVVVADGVNESYDLRKELLSAVVDATGYPRPRGLKFTDALPTHDGVRARWAISQAANGTAVADIDQLDDQAALDAIRAAR